MDEVFRALADPGRRALLDRLSEEGGLTLGELCEVLPHMTRFGVSKHLGVLEAAHLVVTERAGRRKLHHLNPVPIRRIHDRWISKYAEPFAAAMSDLTATFEPEGAGGAAHGAGEARVRDVHSGDTG
ncbi:MAG: metalloregulator ArsR/SmtB family transcription factor [Actinomycetota bacterium]